MSEYYNGIDLVKNGRGGSVFIIKKRNAGKIKYFMQRPNSPMLNFYPDIREAIRPITPLNIKRENNKE